MEGKDYNMQEMPTGYKQANRWTIGGMTGMLQRVRGKLRFPIHDTRSVKETTRYEGGIRNRLQKGDSSW